MAAQAGQSVMQAAHSIALEGIIAECGGAASCATCHVYVDAEFLDRLPPMEAQENQMLDFVASERRPGSRLSCQIPMSDALDGITIHLPEQQL